MKHTHNWSRVGLWETKDKAICPCMALDCPAALLRTPGQDISAGEVLPDRLAQVVKEFEGFTFDDDPTGGVVKVLMTEVIESYKFHKMKFEPGDVVIDIGAHVGVIAVYLAKKWPGITVYAFEPIPENCVKLYKNIEANGVKNIIALNQAISGDTLQVALQSDLSANSGGSSAWFSHRDAAKTILAHTTTLSAIFENYKITHCRLLKIDCEGAEYDILENTPTDVLSRIDSIRGEFHTNKRLRKAGHKPAALRKWLKQSVKDVKVSVCKMAE